MEHTTGRDFINLHAIDICNVEGDLNKLALDALKDEVSVSPIDPFMEIVKPAMNAILSEVFQATDLTPQQEQEAWNKIAKELKEMQHKAVGKVEFHGKKVDGIIK